MYDIFWNEYFCYEMKQKLIRNEDIRSFTSLSNHPSLNELCNLSQGHSYWGYVVYSACVKPNDLKFTGILS